MADSQLVSPEDYTALCWLVIEASWRNDNGASDTFYELTSIF